MKKVKQILTITLLIATIFSNVNMVFANNIEANKNLKLELDHRCVTLLKTKDKNELKEVNYICYKEIDNESSKIIKYPVFGVDPSSYGVGRTVVNSYEVELRNMEDLALWRMLYHRIFRKHI